MIHLTSVGGAILVGKFIGAFGLGYGIGMAWATYKRFTEKI